jgi:hypothetical protein
VIAAMPSFLLELYLPSASSLSAAAQDARRIEKLGGDELRHLRTYFVAEDETCFHVFEASSRDAVIKAASRAGLTNARVTETLRNEEATTPERRIP